MVPSPQPDGPDSLPVPIPCRVASGSGSFVVEIAGQKGVGKSTLGAAISQEARSRGLPLGGESDEGFLVRAYRKLEFVVEQARSFVRAGKLRPDSFSLWWDVASCHERACRRLRRAQRTGGLQLVDEGVFQSFAIIHVLFGSHREMARIGEAFLRPSRIPDLVLVIVASDQTVARRREQRGRPRDADHLEVTAEQKAAVSSLIESLPRWEAAGSGWRHLVVFNEAGADIPRTAARVVDHIEDILRNGR
jgi:deoxyadenosine/deoxycytidine kinase